MRPSNIHFAALGLWLGVLLLAGASAAIIFPTMKQLLPSLPNYRGYAGDHWKLAAGMVQARVFLACDVVCAVSALIACFSLGIVWMRSRWSGVVAYLRVAALILACATLGYQLFILGPIMGQNIRKHWTMAAAGDNAEAEKYRMAFEADHPKASGVLYAQFGFVIAAMLLGIAHKPGRLEPAGTSARG